MLSHHHQLYSSFLLAKQAVDDLYTSVYQACGGAHVQDNSREAWMTATGVQSTADGLQGAARDLLDGARLSLLQLHDVGARPLSSGPAKISDTQAWHH
jgi:hypothetical protein